MLVRAGVAQLPPQQQQQLQQAGASSKLRWRPRRLAAGRRRPSVVRRPFGPSSALHIEQRAGFHSASGMSSGNAGSATTLTLKEQASTQQLAASSPPSSPVKQPASFHIDAPASPRLPQQRSQHQQQRRLRDGTASALPSPSVATRAGRTHPLLPALPSWLPGVGEGEWAAVQGLVVSLIVGAGLGLGAKLGWDPSIPEPWRGVSAVLGWSYFTAWTISFYPQLIQNWKRKSVSGLSLDYLMYSLTGFVAYLLYTGGLYCSPSIQEAYAAWHNGSPSDVQLVDLLFALHATSATSATMGQFALYRAGSNVRCSALCKGASLGLLLLGGAFGTYLAMSGGGDGGAAADAASAATSGSNLWMEGIYMLGSIKVLMTLVKYVPQALLNIQRRSTVGWNISNVLLDLSGGLLALLQVSVDAAARQDVSIVWGNPAKLGISTISLAFDALFICQHYIFYADRNGAAEPVASRSNSGSHAEERMPMLQPVRVRDDR